MFMRRWVNLMAGRASEKARGLIWTSEREQRCEKANRIFRPCVNELYERYFVDFEKVMEKLASVIGTKNRNGSFPRNEKKWPRARERNGPRWGLLWRGHMRVQLSRKQRNVGEKKIIGKWSYGMWWISAKAERKSRFVTLFRRCY